MTTSGPASGVPLGQHAVVWGSGPGSDSPWQELANSWAAKAGLRLKLDAFLPGMLPIHTDKAREHLQDHCPGCYETTVSTWGLGKLPVDST